MNTFTPGTTVRDERGELIITEETVLLFRAYRPKDGQGKTCWFAKRDFETIELAVVLAPKRTPKPPRVPKAPTPPKVKLTREEIGARISAAVKAAYADPERKARRLTRRFTTRPKKQPKVLLTHEELSARMKAANTPEVRAKKSAARKVVLARPEMRANLSVAVKKSWTPERHAKHQAMLRLRWDSTSPEQRRAWSEKANAAQR